MSRETIKILYFRDTDKLCGPGKTIINTFRTIDKGRFSIVLSSGVADGRTQNPFLEHAKEAGMIVEPVIMKGFFDIRAIFRLAAIMRKHRIQILQTHDPQTRRIGVFAAWLAGVPHIASLHGWIQNRFKQKLGVRLDQFLIRFSRGVIVMSETMKRQVVSMGVPGSNIVVLHNAILLEDYPTMTFTQKVREEYGIGKDEKVVAIIGRLSAEKGLDVFIEMASRISRDYQKVKFLIVGDGPLLSECMRKVADLELQGRVIFTGHRNDINDIYGAIDVLAITSFTEGLPNVLLEAFANGKPVVATKVGGIPEIVSHGTNGFLVEPGGIGELVHHVVRLLDNKNLAVEMGQNGRKTVEERLNFWDRTSKLEKVYESIAMGRS